MVSFRRASSEPRAPLRALFKKRSQQSSSSSGMAGSPIKSLFKRPSPATPPVTPDDGSPVEHVTTSPVRSRGDQSTVVSELTYPLELVQHHQQPIEEETFHNDTIHRMSKRQTPDTEEVADESIVTKVLGMVERSCISTLRELQGEEKEETKIEQKPSFAPEWGRAPTIDEEHPAVERDFTQSPDFFEMVLHEQSIPEPAVDTSLEAKTPLMEEKDSAPKKNRKLFSSFRKEKSKTKTTKTITPTTPAATPETPTLGIAKRDANPYKRYSSTSRSPTRAARAESPKRRSLNPAKALLNKARNARERKRVADREKRYKKILLSLKYRNDGSTESEESGDVRVPGLTSRDAYVKSADLIGSECNESKEELAVIGPVVAEDPKPEESREMPETQEEAREAPTEPSSAIPSWRDILGFQPAATTTTVIEEVEEEAATATASEKSEPSGGATFMKTYSRPVVEEEKKEELEPVVEATESIPTKAAAVPEPEEPQESAPPVVEKKPERKDQWKEVVDKKTGRSYYYHRGTRETTWTRPPEDQIYKKVVDTFREINTGVKNLLESAKEESDPQSRTKKEQLAEMLDKVAPPNAKSVDRLVTEYDGREDVLIKQLKSLSESRPFDEPVTKAKPLIRSQTSHTLKTGTASIYSNVSGRTGKMSEMTPQIKNTSSSKRLNVISQPITEDNSEGLGDTLTSSPARSIRSIPSNVPIPRRRELRVEEFSSDRKLAETFDSRRTKVRARNVPPRAPKQNDVRVDSAYLGDNELTDLDRDNESQAESAVSALSEPEQPDSSSKLGSNYDTKRRQLNEAIANEKWDVAAKLSEDLRSMKVSSTSHTSQQRKNRLPNDLDRFIASNNWDAVAGYISKVRSTQQNGQPKIGSNRLSQRSPSNRAHSEYRSFQSVSGDSHGSNPVKRFGARSQLQHSELHSVSSWESYTTGDSEDSSYANSYGPKERFARSRGKKEFVC